MWCKACRNYLRNYSHLIWSSCPFSKGLQMKGNIYNRGILKIIFRALYFYFLVLIISKIVICIFLWNKTLICITTRITFFLLLLCYQDKQGGQIGLVLDCEWAEANSDKIEDKSAAARRLDFQLGWYYFLCLMFFLFRWQVDHI